MVYVDNLHKLSILIQVAIPGDSRVIDKITEKYGTRQNKVYVA